MQIIGRIVRLDVLDVKCVQVKTERGAYRWAIGLFFATLPLYLACNSEPKDIDRGDRLTSFSQEITSPIRRFHVKADGTYTVDLRVKNTGTQSWFGGGQPTTVDASYRWLDNKGNVLPIEGNRAQFDRRLIRPGESDTLKLQVTAPPHPGLYTLWISMVQEGVDWFYLRGAKPLVLHVTVD